MRRARKLVIPALLLAGAVAATLAAKAVMNLEPQAIHVREVTPAEGKAGDILTAHGDALGATRVLEVYLVNDFESYKVEVVEQTDHWFTFRIPAGPSGRFRLGVVGSESPNMLVEPVFVRVIETKGPITGE